MVGPSGHVMWHYRAPPFHSTLPFDPEWSKDVQRLPCLKETASDLLPEGISTLAAPANSTVAEIQGKNLDRGGVMYGVWQKNLPHVQ